MKVVLHPVALLSKLRQLARMVRPVAWQAEVVG